MSNVVAIRSDVVPNQVDGTMSISSEFATLTSTIQSIVSTEPTHLSPAVQAPDTSPLPATSPSLPSPASSPSPSPSPAQPLHPLPPAPEVAPIVPIGYLSVPETVFILGAYGAQETALRYAMAYNYVDAMDDLITWIDDYIASGPNWMNHHVRVEQCNVFFWRESVVN